MTQQTKTLTTTVALPVGGGAWEARGIVAARAGLVVKAVQVLGLQSVTVTASDAGASVHIALGLTADAAVAQAAAEGVTRAIGHVVDALGV